MTQPHPNSDDFEAAQFAAAVDRRIPHRYLGATADHPAILAWQQEILAQALRVRENSPGAALAITIGPSLFLTGNVGSGKTHQAYGALRGLAAAGIRTTWEAVSAPDLYARLRPGSSADADAEFHKAASVRLLILDDLGAGKTSEWTEEITYRLINHRYEHELPSIITSNLPPREVGDVLGDRIASRLAEMATRVVLAGEDRRRTRS